MALSAAARSVLGRMEPHIRYDMAELRTFAPDLTLEALNEVMRELWVAREVERAGYSGWRRENSSTTVSRPESDSQPRHARPPKEVKPEELFDHKAFEGFFK